VYSILQPNKLLHRKNCFHNDLQKEHSLRNRKNEKCLGKCEFIIGVLDTLRYSNTEIHSGFRVEPNKVRFVSRKLLSVFSIHFVTRTPRSIRFSSRTERSEVHIEKTTIGLLDTLRYSNTENHCGFRVEPNEVRFVSRKPPSYFLISFW
jgi:hypothetical protein